MAGSKLLILYVSKVSDAAPCGSCEGANGAQLVVGQVEVISVHSGGKVQREHTGGTAAFAADRD